MRHDRAPGRTQRHLLSTPRDKPDARPSGACRKFGSRRRPRLPPFLAAADRRCANAAFRDRPAPGTFVVFAAEGRAPTCLRMIRPRMASKHRKLVAFAAVLAAAGTVAACGEAKVEDSASNSEGVNRGAELFHERCSGCHTLDAAAAEGSATKVRDRERIDGPNFNQRKETVEQVLYAIHNGGFSGAIMPQNIVVGQDAETSPSSSRSTRGPTSPPRRRQGSENSGRVAPVLDLRRHPRGPGRGARRAGPSPRRLATTASTRCSRSTSAAAPLLPELEALRARKNAASEAIAAAKRAARTPRDAIAAMREVGGAREAARRRAGRRRGAARRGAGGAAEPAAPDAPDEDDGRPRGRPGRATPPAAGPPRARRRA